MAGSHARSKGCVYGKEEGIELDPLSYILLLMLPSVYRLWAKIRLKHMQPMIQTWTTPEVFAGVEG